MAQHYGCNLRGSSRNIYPMMIVLGLLALLTSADCYDPGTSWLNEYAFAALKQDGTVESWGDAGHGGSGVPANLSSVQAIYSTAYAFAALKQDGTVAAWGDAAYGGSGVPSGLSNVKAIYSCGRAFAALKHDGTVEGWGYYSHNGNDVTPLPSDLSNVQDIYSNRAAFAALKQDGTVEAWGYGDYGGSGVPSGLSNVKAIYSTTSAFAALKQDGTVAAWGGIGHGGSGVPSSLSNVQALYSTDGAFAALKQDGTVAAWGGIGHGGSGVPSSLSSVQAIYSTAYAFAALKQDGSVAAWGDSINGGSGVPSGLSNVQVIYSTGSAFAALKQDSTVEAWGHKSHGGGDGDYSGMNVPTGLSNVQAIYSNMWAFAALKQDGTVEAWGYYMGNFQGSGVPAGLSNVQAIYSTDGAFAALKQDGTVAVWGDAAYGGSGVPSGLSNVQAIYGSLRFRGLSTFPHVYQIEHKWGPYPTLLPTSQPSQPSSQPTAQPSIPTSQPTSMPSLQPTSLPSSQPSRNWDSSIVVSSGLRLDSLYLSQGRGFRFVGNSEVKYLGRQFSTYYLSIYVYDTGFGPVESGQYLTFDVNGENILDQRNVSAKEPLKCAPVSQAGVRCRKKGYVNCMYNYEIPAQKLDKEYSGSIFINSSSRGVIASACPSPSGHEIYVRYELTGGKYQATPNPTLSPTQEPTKATTQVNGLQLDINNLDIWKLLQISIATGVLLAGGAVYLCKLREKSKEAYQHPLPYAVTNLGMLGMELTSMIFLMVELFRFGYEDSGGALLGFRIMKMCIGVLIVVGVYFPPSQPFLKSYMDISQYLDWDHMVAESKIYFVVSAMSVADLTFVVFLPWKNSPFATLSKGYPNLVLFRLVQMSLLLTAIVSYLIQVSYLSTTTFVLERDLMFVINLILLSIKLLLITLEFFYKNHILGAIPTVLDDNGDDKEKNGNDVESAEKSEDGMTYTANPMLENQTEGDNEESKPLLEKSVKRMQGQLSSLEVELSTVRAETGSKVEGVETKVGEETRLLRSQMSTLEQDNSALKEDTNLLKEENSVFKARLETLERKMT